VSRRPYIHFETGGRAHGFAGCNRFSQVLTKATPCEIDGGRLILQDGTVEILAIMQSGDTTAAPP
jgi:heat shock protein HslJ